jgi:hypothetical protein
MIHRLRILIPSIALVALTLTGCFVTSGQVLVKFDLPNPVHAANTSPVVGLYVDLNTISAYNDHKDKIKDLTDIALLGTIHNNAATPIDCEIWMVDGASLTLTAGQVQAQGVRVWGPLHIAASDTKKIDWDESSNLFGSGKAPLLAQVKGDGQFSLYLLAPVGTYNFDLTDGGLALVIGAGI